MQDYYIKVYENLVSGRNIMLWYPSAIYYNKCHGNKLSFSFYIAIEITERLHLNFRF